MTVRLSAVQLLFALQPTRAMEERAKLQRIKLLDPAGIGDLRAHVRSWLEQDSRAG
jgi:hypothetical protein